jgi:adenylyltransferase/sulfurtransferase
VPGFAQRRLSEATLVLAGAGGLNGEVAEGLVRKGAGCLKIADGDVVELSNLNRQFFVRRDLYKNKAVRLARNLQALGCLGTQLVAHPRYLQDAFAEGRDLDGDIYLVGVDNHAARLFAAGLAYKRRKPAVVYAVSEDANVGYVFVQSPQGTTYEEHFAKLEDREPKKSCRPVPAVKDILKVVGGLVLYAVDSLLMDRKRFWNFRLIDLAGEPPPNPSAAGCLDQSAGLSSPIPP